MTKLEKTYQEFLLGLKTRISSSRYVAARAVNTELILLYWDIGNSILQKLSEESWGTGVVARLAKDLQENFPGMKGFSYRNLKYMRQFAQAWQERPIGQHVVAQLPWGHNVLILQKISNNYDRLWYAQKALENGWSRNVLLMQIESDLKGRLGSENKTHNFNLTLPKHQSDLANETLKDPYIFDFLSIGEKVYEREIEKGLIDNIQKFLLELGAGFAYMGRQVHLSIGEKDYYIDLLFYHTKLHCYVVIELKAGDFEPEYIGKLNFYLSAVDDLIKTQDDRPTIGILLCKNKDKVTAEYALKDFSKPMGISEYRFGGVLPTIDELKKLLE